MSKTTPSPDFWKETFRPDPEPVEGDFDLSDQAALAQTTGPRNLRMKSASGAPMVRNKRFENCVFGASYERMTFKQCTFISCDFDSAKLKSVKFTACGFQRCNWTLILFDDCQFNGCRFDGISVSADHFAMLRTSISATSFLTAIATNNRHLDHAPQPTSQVVQQHRLLGTKAKVAQLVVQSTRDEPAQDLYFEAHRELVLSQLRWRWADTWWVANGTQVRFRGLVTALKGSIPLAVEYVMTLASGWVTDWGRSVFRPLAVGGIGVALFAALYQFFPSTQGLETAPPLHQSVQRAFDVTLVVGYTKYATPSKLEGLIALVNVTFGLFWYSMVVPVVIRRTIR